ncbi:MAG: RnfABCDGE type electron transport complex subunit D [Oscillospiraceae bacterium]
MNFLDVAPSPHLRTSASTRNVMQDVLIALAPTLVASIYFFGTRSVLMVAVCVGSCVLFEYLYRLLMKQSTMVGDLSAVVTGALLAFCLPVYLPVWMAVIGCFFAIVVTKQLFGGLGKNFANPAIVGRVVLLIAFPLQMTSWTAPGGFYAMDAVTTATPLGLTWNPNAVMPSTLDLFLGRMAGSLGETSALALLIGFAYLLIRRVLTPTITLSYLGTAFILFWILDGDPVFHLLTGGLMLGAIFMATDYVTSPITERGKLIYGIGCGILTVIIRLYGQYPEGVSFAILLMNILTPHINKLTRIKPLGHKERLAAQKAQQELEKEPHTKLTD